jgi:hypothetical protein
MAHAPLWSPTPLHPGAHWRSGSPTPQLPGGSMAAADAIREVRHVTVLALS